MGKVSDGVGAAKDSSGKEDYTGEGAATGKGIC